MDTLPAIEVSSGDVRSLRAAQARPLLLSLRENHTHVVLGIQDGIFKVRGEDGASAKSTLIIAAPMFFPAGVRTILYEQLQEFEDLINSPSTHEDDVHRFFEKIPVFCWRELSPASL